MKELKKQLWKAYVFKFLKSLTFFGALTVPMFTQWAGLTYFEVFMLQVWFMLAVVVFEVPTGVVADCVGRKTSLVLGVFATVLGALVYGALPNFWVFVLGETLFALGGALTSGADKALLYDLLKAKKKTHEAKHVFASYQNVGLLGIMVALPAGTFMASLNLVEGAANYALPMTLTAVPMFLAGLVGLTLHEVKFNKQKTDNYLKFALGGLRQLVTNKTLLALTLELAFLDAVLHFMFWLYQPLLLNRGLGLMYLGVIGAAFNLFTVALLQNLSKFEKFFTTKQLLKVTGLVGGLGFMVAGLLHGLVFALPAVFLVVGAKQLRLPVLDHEMNKHVSSSQRATVLSGVGMAGKVVVALTYPVMGFLVDLDLRFALVMLGLLAVAFTLASRTKEEHFA